MLGDNAAQFDPAQEMHYAISENAQSKLKSLHDGIGAIAQMFDQADPSQGGLHDERVGALFHLVAMALEGALIEHRFVPLPTGKAVPTLREVH
jgi:hypothetical protein